MMKTFQLKNRIMGSGIPKVCIPLMGKTDQDVLAEAKKIASANTNIDMVEFRGDFYENLGDLEKLTSLLEKLQKMFEDKILLFTIRSEAEGGEKLEFISPTVNQINLYVVKNRLSDMVDVELYSGDETILPIIDMAKQTCVRIIMSNHDFNTTPDKAVIVERMTRMQEIGADIAKIAVMPQTRQHVIDLQEAMCQLLENPDSTPLVGISMGKLGAISRITAGSFGSAMTFATLGNASAPGQIPVEELNIALSIVNKYTE